MRRRSQTQTHVGLTSCPRTRSSRAKRYSSMMMLKTGSLFLILYGLCQISLAQAQTPRKDETTGTTQTWKGQELGGVRSVIASRLSKEMALMVTGIEESGEWERMLYGEIDWSDTRKETGM
ncbi:unnamed protein product [Gadus morhua 'NCC']